MSTIIEEVRDMAAVTAEKNEQENAKVEALEAQLLAMIEASGVSKATKEHAIMEFVTLKTMKKKNMKKYLERLLELTSAMRDGGAAGMTGMEDEEEGLMSMAPVKNTVKTTR